MNSRAVFNFEGEIPMVQLALAPDIARKPLLIFIVVFYDYKDRAEHIELYYHRDAAIDYVNSLGATRMADVGETAVFFSDVGTIEILESGIA